MAPAPGLFAWFDPDTFPGTAAEAAAYQQSPEVGETFSLAVRWALFEDGLDVSDEGVLGALRAAHGVPEPTDADRASVHDDFREGGRRGVAGSPHFSRHGDFLSPSLDIKHDEDGYDISFDAAGFHRFIFAVFS